MSISTRRIEGLRRVRLRPPLLNNQHLGMVMQWEDRFFQSNRANTYLGPIDHPETFGKGYPFTAFFHFTLKLVFRQVAEKSRIPSMDAKDRRIAELE
ncbi:MAG: hypothetical protein LBI05_12080, partial [Planctomycetaceae bacterium]|nr:hypothetical protein [Planctomycetaceae bacterium]